MQAAAMMRTLSLPAPFYRAYASGDLSARLSSIETLASMLQNIVLTTGLTSVFSLAYVAQIAAYARLVLPALGVILASAAVSVASVLVQVSVTKRKLEHSARRKDGNTPCSPASRRSGWPVRSVARTPPGSIRTKTRSS